MTPESALPPGWRWVRLGDHVTKIGSGITPLGGHKTYQKSGTPLIRSQNVHMNRFEPEGLAFISEAQDEEMAQSRVLPGDVLLNITGASIGRVCVVPDEICPANVNQHVSIIRSSGSVDPALLAFYLASPSFQEFILDSQAGATRQALTKAQIEEFRVPIADIPEQRRIAARLREQITETNKARASIRAQLEAASTLPSSHLRSIFASPAALQWPRRPLGHLLAHPLRTGLSKSSTGTPNANCLTLASVRNGVLETSAARPVSLTEKERQDNALTPHRFYVVRGNGNISLVARGALAPASVPASLIFPDLLIEVAPNHDILLPQFLRWAWDAPETRAHLEARSMTSAGIYKINLTNLSTVLVPVPPPADQQQAAAVCDDAFKAIAAVTAEIKSRLAALDHLPAALLREAFAGKL